MAGGEKYTIVSRACAADIWKLLPHMQYEDIKQASISVIAEYQIVEFSIHDVPEEIIKDTRLVSCWVIKDLTEEDRCVLILRGMKAYPLPKFFIDSIEAVPSNILVERKKNAKSFCDIKYHPSISEIPNSIAKSKDEDFVRAILRARR